MTTAWLTLLDAREFITDAGDAPLASLTSQLSPAEQARLPGFVRARRRREFILGRLLLRHVAAHAASCSAQQIQVIERAGAGPQILVAAGNAPMLQASLSHAGGWIACAVGAGFSLGVDIETSDARRDLMAMAQAAFSDTEQRWLNARGDGEKAFYQLWCGKEALYKYRNNAGYATGPGLPSLLCDDVDAAPQACEAQLTSVGGYDGAPHLTLCGPPGIHVMTGEITVEALLKKFS
jgi:4'-phosphopantetheinyl transferase